MADPDRTRRPYADLTLQLRSYSDRSCKRAADIIDAQADRIDQLEQQLAERTDPELADDLSRMAAAHRAEFGDGDWMAMKCDAAARLVGGDRVSAADPPTPPTRRTNA